VSAGDQPKVVNVLPDGFVLSVAPGDSVMAAANRAGYYWPTACSANAICTRCVMTVDPDDTDSFGPMGDREREALTNVRWAAGERAGERLACQAQVVDCATVTKKYVRPALPGDLLPFCE